MTALNRLVVLGLSMSSSWGNGHATTYRSLLGALAKLGVDVLFLERNVPWYRNHRDFQGAVGVRAEFYDSVSELKQRYRAALRNADVVMVGSYVSEGRQVAAWVQQQAQGATAFYDIDTPVTLAALEHGTCEYLTADLLRRFDLYFSFTGGPALATLERIGARMARPLYCAVDPDVHQPVDVAPMWQMGYLGTYAADRQPTLERLLCGAARRRPHDAFVVAGAQYPASLIWPANVERREHVAPALHSAFYRSQRFTLNVTRREMRRLGYSPSVRLFEAAACGAAIISDAWPGLGELFTPRRDILIAETIDDIETYLGWSEDRRAAIGRNARARVLAEHTSTHRAAEFLACVAELRCEDSGTLPRDRAPNTAGLRPSDL